MQVSCRVTMERLSYSMTFYVQPRRKNKEKKEIQDAEIHNMKASLCCEKERKKETY